jgi:hypothetical protein
MGQTLTGFLLLRYSTYIRNVRVAAPLRLMRIAGDVLCHVTKNTLQPQRRVIAFGEPVS